MSRSLKSASSQPVADENAVQITLPGTSRRSGREQVLLGGKLVVKSPYGIKPMDRLLIEACQAIPAQNILSVALTNATAAMALSLLRPEARVRYYNFDLFFIRQAEALIAGHRVPNLEVSCLPVLPEDGPAPDLALTEFRRDGEAGLTLELIRQTHDRLAHGGKLLAAINNPNDQWLRRQLERTFGNLTLVKKDKESILYLVKRSDKPAASVPEEEQPERFFVKQVEVNLGDLHLTFDTCYGTFSSDGLDDGSRALLEVMVPPAPCNSILDLGGGWGGMGLLAARRTGAQRLVMVDANARAVEMARRNAQRLGPEQTEVRLEADVESLFGGQEVGQYDAVISNPPYATEFRVTELFITAAWRALRPGGRVWLVGKNNPRMVQRTEEVFGNVEVLRRRGYSVVTAERGDTRRFE